MNDDIETNITDHESILLLRRDVKGVIESQNNFHTEMRSSFKELKDNYAERLNKVENVLNNTDKVFIAKVEQEKRDEITNKRIEKIEGIISNTPLVNKLVLWFAGLILTSVATALIYLVVVH